MTRPERFPTFYLIILWFLLVGCAAALEQEGAGDFLVGMILNTKSQAANFSETSLKFAETSAGTFKGIPQPSAFTSAQANLKRAKVTRGESAPASGQTRLAAGG